MVGTCGSIVVVRCRDCCGSLQRLLCSLCVKESLAVQRLHASHIAALFLNACCKHNMNPAATAQSVREHCKGTAFH